MEALIRFLDEGKRVVVLTGAGCSTESGIPDYRSPGGTWTRHKPMLISEFMGSEASRRYYWARSYTGWERFSSAQPNAAHRALAALEHAGRVRFLITQNVDRLHQAAGSRAVMELHGTNHDVTCMTCARRIPRARMQELLSALNSTWSAASGRMAPDGDMEVQRADTADFQVPACEACGGILKPAVVFFGESVARELVDQAMAEVDEADRLFVVGSSLTVWSGFRFARRAHERGIPLALLNVGPTRADDLATLKVEQRCGDALTRVAGRLLS
ncbi:MAG: NAD-dependent protein deacetylase [Myxococcota bacterium]